MESLPLLHHICKHTTMTNKEILQASLLDIIFYNRNKAYGAYALRKGYDKRLLTALAAGTIIIAAFVMASMWKNNQQSGPSLITERKEMLIREIELPKEKIKEPEKPKEQPKQVVKQKIATVPVVAQAKFTTPPVITKVVKDPMPSQDDLLGKTPSTQNTPGKPADGIVTIPQPPVDNGGGKTSGPSEPQQPDFVAQEKDPSFPGGSEALRKFLAKYLNTPDELEAGEIKTVRIRFVVNKDGSVGTFEIVNSAGGVYDNEVVRVCRKMPKWDPAIQNGINVPVSYVLPVTFIGVGE
jgi:periplasmic protein TonB